MNEQAIVERLVMFTTRRRIGRELGFGISDRNLEGSVEWIMDGFVQYVEPFMTYEWDYDDPRVWFHDAEVRVENPESISLKDFLTLVIEDFRKKQRPIDVIPEQMMVDRQIMKVVAEEMENFRELNVDMGMKGKDGGKGKMEVMLRQKGSFIRSGKVIFDYELPDRELDRVLEEMSDSPVDFVPYV